MTPVEVVGVNGTGYLSGVTSVSVGYEATCAMLSSGGVDCWGLTWGQLGNNSRDSGTDPGRGRLHHPPEPHPLAEHDHRRLRRQRAAFARRPHGQRHGELQRRLGRRQRVASSRVVVSSPRAPTGTCTIDRHHHRRLGLRRGHLEHEHHHLQLDERYLAVEAGRPSIPADGGLTGVSCGSSAFCMAVDHFGYTLNYNGSSWSSPSLIDSGYDGLTGVSCVVGSTFCVAVDDCGHTLSYDGSSWTRSLHRWHRRGLTGVSCVSSTFCMAVDNDGNALMYNGSYWTESTPDSPGAGLTAVSCVSSTFCMAVDNDGNTLIYDGSWLSPPLDEIPPAMVSTACRV